MEEYFGKTKLNDLYDDALELIFAHLNVEELIAIERVCHRWLKLISNFCHHTTSLKLCDDLEPPCNSLCNCRTKNKSYGGGVNKYISDNNINFQFFSRFPNIQSLHFCVPLSIGQLKFITDICFQLECLTIDYFSEIPEPKLFNNTLGLHLKHLSMPAIDEELMGVIISNLKVLEELTIVASDKFLIDGFFLRKLNNKNITKLHLISTEHHNQLTQPFAKSVISTLCRATVPKTLTDLRIDAFANSDLLSAICKQFILLRKLSIIVWSGERPLNQISFKSLLHLREVIIDFSYFPDPFNFSGLCSVQLKTFLGWEVENLKILELSRATFSADSLQNINKYLPQLEILRLKRVTWQCHDFDHSLAAYCEDDCALKCWTQLVCITHLKTLFLIDMRLDASSALKLINLTSLRRLHLINFWPFPAPIFKVCSQLAKKRPKEWFHLIFKPSLVRADLIKSDVKLPKNLRFLQI